MFRVVFRADASHHIGSGHVVRCASLAEQMRRIGWRVSFVCREQPGNFNDWLRQLGFDVKVLGSATQAPVPLQANWLEVPIEVEIMQLLAVILDIGDVDCMVVDHYGLDIAWERAVRSVVGTLMVLDDLASRPHDCDILLDQNYCRDYPSRYQSLVPVNCKCMLGPHNALLRSEFYKYANFQRMFEYSSQRVFAFFGGADDAGLSEMAVEALLGLKAEFPALEADVVLGAANQRGDVLLGKYSEIPWLRMHVQVSNVAELMSLADCAIGAGGGTLWERCLLSLPSVVVIAAENQRDSCEALAEAGAIDLVGDASSCTAKVISGAVGRILSDLNRRVAISQEARSIMQGWWPSNVLDSVVELVEKRAA